MPFAPRSFGTGRPSLIKPSSAAMQQFRRGSPSVAPVPLRMPARPPVANRMQQYNTPPQMPPDRGGPFVPPPMPREMPTPPGGGGVFKQKPSREDAPQDPRIPPGGFGGYDPYRDGNYMGGQGTYIPGVDATGKPIGPPKAGQWIAQDEPMQPGSNFGMPGSSEYSVAPEHRAEYRRLYGGGGGQPGPGNELGSTGQRGMPKYDPRGMGGGEYQMPRNTGYGGGGPRNPDGTPVATTGMGMNEDMLMQPGGGGFSKLDPRYTNPMSGGIAGPSRSGGNDLVGHHGIGFGQDSPLARDNPQFGMPPMPPEMNQLHRTQAFKRGGQVQAYAKGGRVMAKPVAKKVVKAAAPAKTASRGDGIAQRGRTKGTMR